MEREVIEAARMRRYSLMVLIQATRCFPIIVQLVSDIDIISGLFVLLLYLRCIKYQILIINEY
jgi:hypothetical protein